MGLKSGVALSGALLLFIVEGDTLGIGAATQGQPVEGGASGNDFFSYLIIEPELKRVTPAFSLDAGQMAH